MIDELNTSARALLDAARPGLAPDAAALARVRARVAASVAAPAAGAGAIAIKLSILAIVAAVATGAIAHLVTEPDAETGSQLPPVPVAQPVLSPQPLPLQLQPVQPAPPAPPPVLLPQPLPPPQQGARPRLPVPKPPRATLAREVDLLDHAMTSLRAGDLPTTLATIRTYHGEAGERGQLAEDAAAIEVEGLCASHSQAAVGKLATFDERWPRSAQRSRLADACR